ncbi:MAG: hypothetical protein H6713_22545 [Myxococcales bacterium]|nr:hypothetical protein [Myxococcales bacterium]MCB9752744.1 hypothetical protein [Myxococcales bacterium]
MAVALFVSFLGFAVGLMLASLFVREIKLQGFVPGLKAAGLYGLASAGLGLVAKIVIKLLFLPIVLLGPLGDLLIQALVNVALMIVGPLFAPEIKLGPRRTTTYVAVALAVLQIGLQIAVRYWN